MKDSFIATLAAYFNFIDWIMDNLVKGEWLKMENFTWMNGDTNIFAYFQTFAISLTMIYFIIECNKRWAIEGNDISIKSVGAPFFKLGLAVSIIVEIRPITGALLDTINAWISKFAPSDSSTTLNLAEAHGIELAEKIYEGSGPLSFVLLALYLLFAIVFIILALVIMLGFMYKAFCFQIEFWFRMGFTSIACADIYSGTNSQAVRWLKSCIGFGLYGVAFVLMPTVVDKLAGSFAMADVDELIDCGENLLTGLRIMALYMLSPVVAFGMLGTIKQVTKEAMG